MSRRPRLSTLLVSGCVALSLLTPPQVRAQSKEPSGVFSIPINLQMGIPQGEFADNVDLAWGFGLGAIWMLNDWVGFRGGLDIQIYGHNRQRVPLGGGALGLINVDVTTTNAILGGNIGAQIGVPASGVRPYVGGLIGFSNFGTTSSVEGSNSNAEPFATTTNASDNAFSKIAFGGVYIPIGSGGTVLDIGARYTWNGESVTYLTEGDVIEDANGDIQLNPRQSRADLLTITLGLSFGRRRPR